MPVAVRAADTTRGDAMFSRKARLVVALMLALGLVGASIAAAGNHGNGKSNNKGHSEFSAHLTGFGENPSLYSPAQGDLKLTIGSGQLTWTLKYSGFINQPSAAHVHISAPGVNGGVSFFFCGGAKPACPSSAGGPVTISGTTLPADILGPTAQSFPAGQLDPVIAAIKAGVTYANMHTSVNPGGEIRGQLEGGHGDNGDDD